MPRNREHIKNKTWNKVASTKFRIGNRKGGVAAQSLSTKELITIVSNNSKSKYHKNAYAVLANRKNIAESL